MKPKKYEEVNYIAMGNKTLKEKRWLNILLMYITIAIIVALSFMNLDTAIDYEALKQEKEVLESTAEMQSSMISDLEENCKYLFIELENLKYGGINEKSN